MRVAAVVESLERDLELLCLTGVEDKLQDQVRPTLELLRNAGIRIWMLTGMVKMTFIYPAFMTSGIIILLFVLFPR